MNSQTKTESCRLQSLWKLQKFQGKVCILIWLNRCTENQLLKHWHSQTFLCINWIFITSFWFESKSVREKAIAVNSICCFFLHIWHELLSKGITFGSFKWTFCWSLSWQISFYQVLSQKKYFSQLPFLTLNFKFALILDLSHRNFVPMVYYLH